MKFLNPDYYYFHPRYWFGQVDSRPLSLFRILYAVMLIKDALYHLTLAEAFYSEDGITPLNVLKNGLLRDTRFSLMDALPETWMAQVFFVLWGLIAFALLIGYRTRLMTLLNFLFVLSIHERNLYVVDGSDTVMRVLAFWMMFLPLGHYYSFDAIRRRWRRYLKTHVLDDLRVADSLHTTFALPLRMIQIQVAIIYVFTSILKLPGEAWRNGDAIFMALQLRTLTLPTGDWAVQHVPQEIFKAMTWFSLTTELAFAFLVFLPFFQPSLRALGLLMGMMLHLGIAVLMAVPNFSLMMMISYITLYEPAWVRWLDARLKMPRQRLTIGLPPPGNPLWLLLAITRPADVVVAQEVIHPAERLWVLDQSDVPRSDDEAERLIAAYLPLSRLWGWSGLLRKLIFWIGSVVASLDPLPLPTMLGTTCLVEQPVSARMEQRYLRLIWQGAQAAVLIPLMIIVIWSNVRQIEQDGKTWLEEPVPERSYEGMRYLGLWQGWDMFSPFPLNVDGWISIPGVFEDGTTFDLRTREPVPETLPRAYWGPSARWKKYESNLNEMRTSSLLEAWAGYYCRIYNNEDVYGKLPEGKRLATLEIHWRYRYSTPPEQGAPGEFRYEDAELWRHWCLPGYEY